MQLRGRASLALRCLAVVVVVAAATSGVDASRHHHHHHRSTAVQGFLKRVFKWLAQTIESYYYIPYCFTYKLCMYIYPKYFLLKILPMLQTLLKDREGRV
jgi:hypothetical protein